MRALVCQVDGARWAIVEYAPGSGRPEFCEVGHEGYVISGEIEYEFESGGKIVAKAGEGFVLPDRRPAPRLQPRDGAGPAARDRRAVSTAARRRRRRRDVHRHLRPRRGRPATIAVAKVPSTPADPIEAVIDGVRDAAGVDLRDVVALLARHDRRHERADHAHASRAPRWSRRRGFRDVIEIRRGTKDDLWDAYKDVAPPYIRRRDRFEVAERVDYDGERARAARRGRRRGEVARDPAQARRRDRRRLLHQRVRQPRERAAHAGDPRGGAAGRERLDLERGAAGDLRARALLDHGRERRALAARRRLRAAAAGAARGRRLRRRPPAAALRRRRDDAEARPSSSPSASPPRASPPARSRAATSRRCAAIANAIGLDMGGTSHRHLARLRRARSGSRRSGSSSTATRSASRRSRC